jgi:hypothetical protein
MTRREMLQHPPQRVHAYDENECLDVRLPARQWGERVATEVPGEHIV